MYSNGPKASDFFLARTEIRAVLFSQAVSWLYTTVLSVELPVHPATAVSVMELSVGVPGATRRVLLSMESSCATEDCSSVELPSGMCSGGLLPSGTVWPLSAARAPVLPWEAYENTVVLMVVKKTAQEAKPKKEKGLARELAGKAQISLKIQKCNVVSWKKESTENAVESECAPKST